ncbi:MAG: DUF4091 domain-containing protein [Oscillospiraceae bacterium]|nr:DUF4091 domain-containing protein [Oscillospiraceae bacterium]
MLTVKPCSSLAKIFSDEAPDCAPYTKYSLLAGEELSFQLAVRSDTPARLTVALDGGGAALCECFWVEEIPAGRVCGDHSDDYFLRKTPGRYPDLLRPANAPKTAEANKWLGLWITLRADEPGPLDIKVLLRGQDGTEASAAYHIEVLPVALPEQTLLCTHWFHCDCLADLYAVPVFSGEHWALIENYLRCAAAHGNNMVLTPLFTPPLDTAVGGERPTVQLVGVNAQLPLSGARYDFDFSLLERWIALCDRVGVKYFELSHLFTQWGAKHAPKIMATVNGSYQRIFGWETDADSPEYTEFLGQFAAALLPFLEARAVRERCYLHVSDEPAMEDLERYARRGALVRGLFPGIPVIDALSDFDFYQKGLLERPIPSVDHIEPFVGQVPELWTYYCCSQDRYCVPNRFFAMPSQRSRVLGFLLWKYRCHGFLHWAFNFWYAQFSLRAVDPFTETDAGGAFPAGDSFLVYPGENGGPLLSLRLKVFHEALQDQRALALLEAQIGYEQALRVLEKGLEEPLTFRRYPHSDSWQLETRERINRAILHSAQYIL